VAGRVKKIIKKVKHKIYEKCGMGVFQCVEIVEVKD